MPRRVNRPLGRILVTAVAVALLAAACTPDSGSDDAAPQGSDTTTATETTVEQTTSPPDVAPIAPPPPAGESLSLLPVDPPVARPGEQFVVSVPFAGILRVTGRSGVLVETEVEPGQVTLDVPPGTADGEYLVTVRTGNPGISIGDLRVSAVDGVWVTADLLTPRDEDVVRIRITSLGLDDATPTLLGLGPGWEAQIGDTDVVEEGEELDEEGPVGLLTPLESGLLIDGGFETIPLGDLTNRELFLAGTDADVIQAIVFSEDDAFFSEPVEIGLCNDPGVVAGSIGGPGGVRIVSTGGGVSSVAVLTEDGVFSLEVPAGGAMLFGWVDGDGSPAMLEPVPLDVPCGGEVQVGELPGAAPEPSNAGVATASLPCRTIVLPGVVDESGAVSPVETQVVAGTLRAVLADTEVISLSDLDAMVRRLPDTGTILRAHNLANLAGVGTPFSGSFYVSGVRHESGIALASYPSSDGDAESSATAEQVIAASRVLAEAMIDDALCFDADALHARSGETTEWQLEVTDLSGAPYTGAAVDIANEGSGTFSPTETAVDDGPVTFTYTPGPDAEVDPFFADAQAGEGSGAVNASFASAAGAGLTWVLMGAKFNEVATGPSTIFGGQLGAGVVACADHPDGPYTGFLRVQLANFFELGAVAGGILDATFAGALEAETPAWGGHLDTISAYLPQFLSDAGEEAGEAGAAWAFGADPTGLLDVSGEILAYVSSAFIDFTLQLDGFTGLFYQRSFSGNKINLLSNDGYDLDGVLNPITRKVKVTAEGLHLLPATIFSAHECPVQQTLDEFIG